MGIFDFFKKKRKSVKAGTPSDAGEDRSQWTGKKFEFLITGDVEIPAKDFDRIMTPNTFEWTKVIKNNWYYYQVANDEFTYSIEPPGIQMTFNKEITFEKARLIADQVISNIKATGQAAELVVLNSSKVYRFDS